MRTFYWSTHIIIIDDDRNIIDALQGDLEVLGHQLHYFYTVPEALDFMERQIQQPISDFCTIHEEHSYVTRGIKVDLKSVPNLMQDQVKNSVISVVISDYDMPEMLGTEFLSKVQQLVNAERVLLTGKFSPREAIHIKGQLIADYIEKDSQGDFIKLLQNKIHKYVNNYFNKAFNSFGLLSEKCIDLTILKNEAFIAYFDAFCKEKSIVEYYLLDYTGTYYLIAKDGIRYCMVVYDDNQLISMIEEYNNTFIKRELLEQLQNRQYLAVKFSDMQICYPEDSELEQHLRPVSWVLDDKYYVAVFPITA